MQKFLFAYVVETSRGAVTYHPSLPLEKNVANYEPLSWSTEKEASNWWPGSAAVCKTELLLLYSVNATADI